MQEKLEKNITCRHFTSFISALEVDLRTGSWIMYRKLIDARFFSSKHDEYFFFKFLKWKKITFQGQNSIFVSCIIPSINNSNSFSPIHTKRSAQNRKWSSTFVPCHLRKNLNNYVLEVNIYSFRFRIHEIKILSKPKVFW